ncbi:MAG: ABC transporter permease [Cyclobacteriaceae bacterium]
MNKITNHITPPKWPLRFLRFFVKKDYLEEIEGDMEEEFYENLKQHSAGVAKRSYALEVVKLLRPAIIKKLEGTHHLNHYGMFKNYFKVGVRNILKYKSFSFINIFGLAVAMSVCMLIILMLADQMSYDQFHEKKEKIYRILIKPGDHKRPYATTPNPLADVLKTDFPMISEATNLRKGFGGDAVYKQNYAEIRGYFTDPSFFKIFSYSLEKGNRYSALAEPNTMVITQKIAHQLFGNENPIGKTIDFSDRGIDMFTEEGRKPVPWGHYTVTGVLSASERKTHLKFDVLVSSSSLDRLYADKKIYDASAIWGDYSTCYTYALINESSQEEALINALQHFSAAQYRDDERLKHSTFMPQPLTKISLGPALGNDPNMALPMFAYYVLAGLAFVVMLSACLNYTNLSIARVLTRSKEIAVRKVNGARRRDLIFQFLSESMITSFLSLLLAIGLLLFVKAAFLNLWVNQFLNFDLGANIIVYLAFLGLALLIGLVAGIFPAMKLSGYSPISALKNMSELGAWRLGLRKTLTVAQFVISLIFIVTTMVGFNQFRHFMDYEYNFDARNVVNINLQSNDYHLVKNAFASVPGITHVSACAYLPGGGRNDGITIKTSEEEEGIQSVDLSIDEGFIGTLDIALIAGRNLSKDGVGAKGSILVNEEFVRVFGYNSASEIIGRSFEGNNGQSLKVIGVVENFTFSLLFNKQIVRPVILRNDPGLYHFANVKIESANKKQVIAQLEEKWKTVDPIHPMKYEFFEDKLSGFNQGIFDLVSVIGFFAFLAISIACLGLLGMAIYTTERRTKEIGIRKVLGAGSFNLTYLLSREFLILLGIAVVIAAPLSFFVNSLWLDFLVVRVDFGVGTVLLGSLLLLLLGILTIAPQTFFVSRRNPVDSLKDE